MPRDFRPTTKRDIFEEIPLYGRPEFKGGILESDSVASVVMQTETKEITKAPSTETKDAEVESGVSAACTDPKCRYAGSWHTHSARE